MKPSFKDNLQTWAAPIGGLPALASKLKIQRQAIYQWKRIPADRLLDIEKITGVSRRELRPDLFKGLSQ